MKPFALLLSGLMLFAATAAHAGAEEKELIRQLMARIDQLEKKVSDLEGKATATLQNKWAAAPAASSQTQSPPSVVGESRTPPPAEEPEKSIENALVNRNAIVLNPGTWELEPSLSYSYSSTDSVIVNGFSIYPVLVVGSVTSEEIRRDTSVATLTGRVGLPRGFQLDARIPYQYIAQERTLANGDFFSDDVAGIGDVSVGLSKELMVQRDYWPNLIGRVSWKGATGDSVYDGDALGIGSGFQSVRGELTALRIIDPAAVYATLGYVTNFEENKSAGQIDLGDSIELALGTTLAVNRDLAFSLGVQDSWSFESSLNGNDINGSSLNAASLNFGMSYALWNNRRLDFSTSAGLTRDAPDYTLLVSMPFRFGE